MVQHKTAGLFRLGITLLQASHARPRTMACSTSRCSPPQSFSEDTRDFIPLCNDLGLYYQVMDDVLNLKSAEMFGHKSFCEDLTEGKFSFPIVHHVLASPGDTRVLSILRKKTADSTLKQFAVRCLEETRSFEYATSFPQ
jgi:geranylgeranyl diphosphate synthase type 3